jgi:RNA polymerase sigma factor (sigma-70 family)
MPKEKPQLQDREFELMLTWLGDDSERGAHAYLEFHKRTTGLFINWHACAPEDLADETLSRLAHQLSAGKEIDRGSRSAYVHGIAKNIRREHWRNCETCKRQQITRDDANDKDPFDSLAVIGSSGDSEDAEEKERRLQCLDDCLEQMSAEERSVLLEYYAEDKTRKIVKRDRLAERLGVTSGALRQRIWKLRTPLRDCVVKCVAE